MKTKKIYVMNLNVVSKKRCYITGDTMRADIETKSLKKVLVKKNIFRYIDLKTNEKYSSRVSCYSDIGDKFLMPENKISFNELSDNSQKHLSKKKVLSIFNSIKDEQ